MKNILVIEDSQNVRENIQETLELADFQVVTACNGKEGVELIREHLPDLILCDISMPILDGYGVLHILNKNESTRNIPFIFMTAKAEKSEMRKGMNLGADDYLTKPFNDTELLDAVSTRLKKAEITRKDYSYGKEGLNHLIDEMDISGASNPKERKVRSFKKKKDIYLEGDVPLFLMHINKGKVKTYKTNEEGKELITGIYGPGEFFGYESLLDGEYRESATTMEDVEITMVPKNDFVQLLYGDRNVSEKFIALLSNKVTKKESQLLDLAYNTVRQRTAKALIEIREDSHNSAEEGIIDISREDLANMVGTATETVIRVLSDFKEEGIIQITSGKISIHGIEGLKTVAEKHYLV